MPGTVTIVITCYNHGHYLSQAIDSILRQSYKEVEIIVVDDGSTDHTRSIAQSYKEVSYVFQKNQGLSAARNTGIEKATGKFILFLDADDWLFDNALAEQLKQFSLHPQAVAVVGQHKKVLEDGTGPFGGLGTCTHEDHYSNFLEKNFVGMHAAVLFRKSVFDNLRYDTELTAAEDYDLMLRITRNHLIHVHQSLIAAYRQHASNMSHNIPLMLSMVLKVLERQKPLLKSPVEETAFANGMHFWNTFYTEQLIGQKIAQLEKGKPVAPVFTSGELAIMKANRPDDIKKIHSLNNKLRVRRIIKKLLGWKTNRA